MQSTAVENPDEQLTLGSLSEKLFTRLAIFGIGALVIAIGLGVAFGEKPERLLRSYLVSFCFVTSLSLGTLFFVAVHHVTRGGWGIVVRRICEIVAANVLLLAALALPILITVVVKNASLYEWINPATYTEGGEDFSALIQGKRAYLNEWFFLARSIGYFVVWWGLSRFFLTQSVKQDESGDPSITLSMERWSPLSLILFAITVTFASFDWLMSLEPEWFSTIFGLYFFAGSVVSSLSFVVLLIVGLQKSGRITTSITPEHYHDLGKLIFAFIVFWGYMAFSQYMLIWYANVPEETVWYQDRQDGGWMYLSLFLLFGHLLIPFLGLMPRTVKRTPRLLAFWAAWMLFFHWVDLYYIVMPSLGTKYPPFGLTDICIMLGVISLYLAGIARMAGDTPLVPRKDPRLGESLAFENH